MRKIVIIITMLCCGFLAIGQNGEQLDVLSLKPRGAAPTNPFWGDGSLYRNTDGKIYHKVLGAWVEFGLSPVQSVAGKTGAVTLVKGDVGLANVDNTSDLAKPISTATQTALDTYLPKTAGASQLLTGELHLNGNNIKNVLGLDMSGRLDLKQAGHIYAETPNQLRRIDYGDTDDYWYIRQYSRPNTGSSFVLDKEFNYDFATKEFRIDANRVLTTADNVGTPNDNSVTSAKIVDGTIVNNDIANGVLSGTKFLANTIAGDRLQDNTLTAIKMQDGIITSAKILDGTIIDADINASAAIAATKIANTPSGNLAATTVQGALNELQTDVDNATSATPLQITTSRALTSTDLNRILWSNSGTELSLTVNSGLGVDGDIIYMMPYTANSVLKPVSGTTTLLNTYKTSATAGDHLIYRKVNGNWIGVARDGVAYVACTAHPNERYITSSAISDPYCNESNSIGSFTGNTGAIDVTTVTDSFAGLYALKSQMNTGATAGYGQRTVTALNGDTFTVTLRMKTTQSTGSTGLTAWTNVTTGGPSADYIEVVDGWVSRTYNITVSGNFVLRFYASAGGTGAIGDNIIVDNLSIVQTNI